MIKKRKSKTDNRIRIRQCVKQDYIEMDSGGLADLSYPTSKLRRGRVQEEGWICPTLTCSCSVHRVVRKVMDVMGEKRRVYHIRRLTPEDQFALMGMPKENARKCMAMGVPESALLKQTGNGIVSNCVTLIAEHIYKLCHDSSFVCTDEKKRMEQGIFEKAAKSCFEGESGEEDIEKDGEQLSMEDFL